MANAGDLDGDGLGGLIGRVLTQPWVSRSETIHLVVSDLTPGIDILEAIAFFKYSFSGYLSCRHATPL